MESETELRSGRQPRASQHSGETTTAGPCTILNEWSNSNWQTCFPGLFIRLQLVSFAVWGGILGAAGSSPKLHSHSHIRKTSTTAFLYCFHLHQLLRSRIPLLNLISTQSLLHSALLLSYAQTVFFPTILNCSSHLGETAEHPSHTSNLKLFILSECCGCDLVWRLLHKPQVLWNWWREADLVSMSVSLSLYYIATSWEEEKKEEEDVQRHFLSFHITLLQPLLGYFDKYKLNNSTDHLIYFMALSHCRCTQHWNKH